MQKVIALALLVVAIWVGVTIYQEGAANAFGGLFARFGGTSTHAADSTLQRVRAGATQARDRQLRRIERQLGEPSVGLRDD